MTPDNATAWDIMYLAKHGITIEKSMGMYYWVLPDGEWVFEVQVPLPSETNWKQEGF